VKGVGINMGFPSTPHPSTLNHQRNMEAAKCFDNLWRPQVHMVGAVVHGVVECYWALDCDVRQDSNMQRTVLMKTLGKAKEILGKRGLDVPSDIIFHVGHKMTDMTGARHW
jgi:hypothetical protein